MIKIESVKNKSWFQLPKEVQDWAVNVQKFSYTAKTPAEVVRIFVTTYYEENAIIEDLRRLYPNKVFHFTDKNRDYFYDYSKDGCEFADLHVYNKDTDKFELWDIKSIYDEKYWNKMKDKFIEHSHKSQKLVVYNRGDCSLSIVDISTGKRTFIDYLVIPMEID